MKRLLEQLDSIEAIIDTVSPSQIEDDPQDVASRYDLYARSYDPLDRVTILRDRLIAEIHKGKPVNGYLSADYGYGKTATLIYLWHECQQHKILAVPPFKFKELGNLMVATYGWMKACGLPDEVAAQLEKLYSKYNLKSLGLQAAEIARKYKVSEDKALKIVQELKPDTTSTDTILNFWQESIPILRQVDWVGLAVFADESQEFLRAEEGSSARIQILSDLVKGMRALGSTPIALILSMPTTPTESAIEEQASDIIHRMKEQKVSLRLVDVYNYEFPARLWYSLCEKFLDDKLEIDELAHPALIESLVQLCDRKDLTCGPRALIEVFKRLVQFRREKGRAYTPLDLIQDYLNGKVQFYGAQQHKINNAIDSLEQLPSIQKHPKGRDVIKLLALFPTGVSHNVAEEFGLLDSLKELADNDDLYGYHITRPTEHSFALDALSKPTNPTIIDQILNRFRQQWFGEWDSAKKEEMATKIFKSEIITSLFPVSRSGQKTNWVWRTKDKWKQDRFGIYNFLIGAPEKYSAEFPNRSLVISIGNEKTKLMRFIPPEKTQLDWRFYLSYEREAIAEPQKLTSITGTGQVDFYIQLGRSFKQEYPTAFGLLTKVISAKHCSACTLLSLSYFIQDWLGSNPEVSKADRARLEHHRQECHQFAMGLLFPAIQPDTWIIESLEGLNSTATKLIESVFYQKCKVLFPKYKSFYNNLRPTLLKYKFLLEKLPLAVRQGHQLHQVTKEEFEKLFEATGSGLPSMLAVLKQNSLIDEYKIASKKEEKSQVNFSEHPLELFIQEQLKFRGEKPTVETPTSWQDVKTLEYQELWEEAKNLGYLQEEFEEAIEWLQRRRHVEWDRVTGVIQTCVTEIDSTALKGILHEHRSQIALLLELFDERILHEINETINETEASFVNNCNSELVIDQVQRNIQLIKEHIEVYKTQKFSVLQKEVLDIKFKLGNLTKELHSSKVSQPISSNSGLEICLNDYQKNLERQINQLDKDCQKQVNSIKNDGLDIRQLYYQLKQYSQYLKDCEETKRRLQPLVAGLENWRIILARASVLRENLTSNPERLMCYEDEFIDRVVKHFSIHQIESFREYEQLQRPLIELEEQVKGEQQSRREAFAQQLSQYESLLIQVVKNHEIDLKERCKFDDEDRNGSYNTLRQVVYEKLAQEYNNHLGEWEQIERDLLFIEQECKYDVTKLLTQVTNGKAELLSEINLLTFLISDLEKLEKWINKLKIIFDKYEILREEFRKINRQKKQQLSEEEQQVLTVIVPVNNGLTISQLRKRLSYNRDIWDIMRVLYEKGHLEITLHQRD
ncbi:hypothetical protein [Scytonema sp. NUACC26]|uniref:hypothetical protein n=1 Tax=Scytonema sp. NUACC26 TaxID=3140176 RepID=UPI0034DC69B8